MLAAAIERSCWLGSRGRSFLSNHPKLNSNRKALVHSGNKSRRNSSKGLLSISASMGLPAAGIEEKADDVGTSPSVGLVGFDRFTRTNPRTDRFEVIGFHHVEFWCGDASNTWRRFAWGLGMQLVAKSDQSTGNRGYASYVTKSGELVFAFTAPYGPSSLSGSKHSPGTRASPQSAFEAQEAFSFFEKHGLGVRAVGIRVVDARQAYETSIAHGGIGVAEPLELVDEVTGERMVTAEVLLYGDVVMRLVSYRNEEFSGAFLPNYEMVNSTSDASPLSLGIKRLDHAVGNVPKLLEAMSYLVGFTGFHEFAEFTADDIGTSESGLNSVVLASNNEMVLLPVNEPVHGTKRRSQIQTYLEHNEGAGLQHLALSCDDIFTTLRAMRMRSSVGGFEFMPSPNSRYYKELPQRIGDSLSPEQVALCEELGILVDKDDQGVLLQIFTKPVGDRPTMFLEIIQRIGCMEETTNGNGATSLQQKGGCGGFGKGNFAALFKSIEDYEKTLDA